MKIGLETLGRVMVSSLQTVLPRQPNLEGVTGTELSYKVELGSATWTNSSTEAAGKEGEQYWSYSWIRN